MEVDIETDETPTDSGDTVVVAPVVIMPDNDPEPEPVPTVCEHTATITDLVERVTRLESTPEPEPVIVETVEPEPTPEPDAEPERTHWFHEPIFNG